MPSISLHVLVGMFYDLLRNVCVTSCFSLLSFLLLSAPIYLSIWSVHDMLYPCNILDELPQPLYVASLGQYLKPPLHTLFQIENLHLFTVRKNYYLVHL